MRQLRYEFRPSLPMAGKLYWETQLQVFLLVSCVSYDSHDYYTCLHNIIHDSKVETRRLIHCGKLLRDAFEGGFCHVTIFF